jgi:hypothetical protein
MAAGPRAQEKSQKNIKNPFQKIVELFSNQGI